MSTLDLRSVAKRFDGGGEVVRAVDDVTLTLAGGEFVALYGPSGSGKTTLLMLAAGLIAPDRGQVIFDGVDLARLTASERAAHRLSLGFVFQTFHLMPGVSAVDNASLKLLAEGWKPAAARAKAGEWLELLGIAQRAGHPPERLSMGERQRVAIARALANEPRLILADEPTGNLDTTRGRETLSLLARVCRERDVGVLLVTHDSEAARFAERVFDLRDGRLHHRVAPRIVESSRAVVQRDSTLT